MAYYKTPAPGFRLSRKSIFILPTLQGIVFGFGALTVMLIALVERNPVSLLLAGLMLSIFLTGLLLCYRNVSGLWLQTESSDAGYCFAGGAAQFNLQISGASHRRSHQDLWLGFSADNLIAVSIESGEQRSINLVLPATSRGVFFAPRLLLRTAYPAGLWRAWSRPDLLMSCLVYPQPLPCVLPNHFLSAANVGIQNARPLSLLQRGGIDDFVGLREYQPGDSLRHIAWQSLARGQGLKTRQFAREPDRAVVLDWEMFVSENGSHDKEQILSFMCYQILELSRQNALIGLRMPGMLIKPAQGEAHKHQLLEVLARWP